MGILSHIYGKKQRKKSGGVKPPPLNN